MSAYQFQVYSGQQGHLEIKDIWTKLQSSLSQAAFYHDWRWYHAFHAHLATANCFSLLALKEGEPLAILPLQVTVEWRGPLPVRYLRFQRHVAIDLSDMLLADNFPGDFCHALLLWLKQAAPFSWDILELTHFTERSHLRRLLHHAHYMDGLEAFGQSAYTHLVSHSLPEDLSRKKIKNVQRHCRNAEEQYGQISFRSFTQADDITEPLHIFLAIEASGWKGCTGSCSAIIMQPDTLAFYQQLLQEFGTTNQAIINLLYFGEKPVAGQIGLRVGKIIYFLKKGFDEAFRDVGPGGILLLKALQQASTTEATELSLVTCPAWSERWHFNKETTYSFSQFNCTLYARLLRLIKPWHEFIKTLLGNKTHLDNPHNREAGQSPKPSDD